MNFPPVVVRIIVNPELQYPRLRLDGNILANKAESTHSNMLQETNNKTYETINLERDTVKNGLSIIKIHETKHIERRMKIIFLSG
jgi:hypothetical protein